MFKKFWASGYIVFLLYMLGAAFWVGALFSSTYKRFFCAALICIIAGFVRSLSWLWEHRIFERPSLPYSRRYSDTHPNEHTDLVSHQYAKTHVERRRRRRRRPEKRKKLRLTAEMLSILLFIAAGVGLKKSFATRNYKEAPLIDVLVSEEKQPEAMSGQQPSPERIKARTVIGQGGF